MNLLQLPRHSHAAHRSTVAVMLRQEPTLSLSVRRRAEASLCRALESGRASPEQVEAAATLGDVGIANLMRELAPEYRLPNLAGAAFPATAPPEGTPNAASLCRFIRMLSAGGHLDSERLAILSDAAALNPAQIQHVMRAAWDSLKAEALATPGLPAALATSSRGIDFQAIPLALVPLHGEDDDENWREMDIGRVLAIYPRGDCYNNLRNLEELGEGYQAVRYAINRLIRSLYVPLVTHPDWAVEILDPSAAELLTDLYAVTTFDADGVPHFHRDDLQTLLENLGAGDDDISERAVELHRNHMRLMREAKRKDWTKEQVESWRMTAAPDQASLVCEIITLADVLAALPKPKALNMRGDGYCGQGSLCILPTGHGLDAWMEECVNCVYNAGDYRTESYIELPANPARFGQCCKRVLIDLAAINYVDSLLSRYG